MNRPEIEKTCSMPFRLGCTSYVIPDEIFPNVQFMAPLIDDIELVLFETPGYSNLPSPIDIQTLARELQQHHTTVTVHLPTDRNPLDDPEGFVASACSVIDLCKPLHPYAYVLHLEGLPADATSSRQSSWQTTCRRTLEKVFNTTTIEPERISVENLGYSPELLDPFCSEFGLSRCLDIGHLWLQQEPSWSEHVTRYLPSTRVVHLHGIDNGKDHVSLQSGPIEKIRVFLNFLQEYAYSHVLTLEVFNKQDTFESIRIVRELWEN